MKQTAIIYYSLANGNTYSIARRVQQQAGGRLIRIETVRPIREAMTISWLQDKKK